MDAETLASTHWYLEVEPADMEAISLKGRPWIVQNTFVPANMDAET